MARQDDNLGLQGYQFEPEFDDGELAEIDRQAFNVYHESDEENETEEDNERLTDITSWCECTKCHLMETVLESKCCMEDEACRNRMPNAESTDCITTVRDFTLTCLERGVLQMTINMFHELRGNVRLGALSNRSYRFAAYRNFIYWVHGRLGQNVRKVIPSCVVMAIRSTFPSDDGQYVGFQNAEFQDAFVI